MLTTIFNTLGISLDDVYLFDSYPLAITNNLVEPAMNMLDEMQNGKDVDDWKEVLTEYVKYDELLFDDEKLAEYNKTATSPLTPEIAIYNFCTHFLKYETSYVFATTYVTAEMKQRTTQLCEELRQSFRERIQSNAWMSEASKQNAMDKLDAMTFNIGAPDTWYEEGLPDISDEETLYDDVLAIRGTLFNLQKKLLGKPTKSNSFHLIILESPLTTTNAFYVPNYNSINIYPMWMVKPGYDAEQNEAHNYATMAVFGHEITHGFDTNGAKWNKVGDLEDIWASDADRQEFAKRAQQLIDYYSTFEVMPLTGVHCDGAYTAGENIADLGGFQIAYDDYVNHLKAQGFKDEQLRLQRQRFFEAYAYHWSGKWTASFAESRTLGSDDPSEKDEHALFRERINGVVTNTDDWYDLFDVKPTDKLYLAPENRIRIW
jgi:putative endopeptidase